jgi:hypothetical protein
MSLESLKRRILKSMPLMTLGTSWVAVLGKNFSRGPWCFVSKGVNPALTPVYIVCSGSGMLGLSIGLNAMSTHGACTAVFVGVCAILVGLASSIQTMSKIAWLAYVGAASILAAGELRYMSKLTQVLTLVIAVGVSDRPSLAPATGPWTKEIIIAAPATFAAVGSTLGGMMYTLAGTPM